MSTEFSHRPVMEAEVVEMFSTVPDGLVVDVTLGGGGHAAALLGSRPGFELVGIDRDATAIAAAGTRLEQFGERVTVRQGRFDEMASVVAEHLATRSGAAGVDDPVDGGVERSGGVASGVFFDLGVSSPQLDDPSRGFSFRGEGPLDMRMDVRDSQTAATIVNSIDEFSLVSMLRANGEGRLAPRIARAIIAARPFETTTQLAEVVRAAVPPPARRRGHPAVRVFQALRIEVNQELHLLALALDSAIGLLVPGGRCVVLSYHSGEDRLVKQRFAFAGSGGCSCPPALPCVCGAVPLVRVLTRGARLPGKDETAANPRAASARLRAVEKLATELVTAPAAQTDRRH